MQFLRTLSVLVLLLTGNMGIAFASFQDLDHFQENAVTSEYSEDGQDFAFSNLASPYTSNFSKVFVFDNQSFDLESYHKSAEAKKYLVLSRYIDPSLDIPEIIFPFHFFL